MTFSQTHSTFIKALVLGASLLLLLSGCDTSGPGPGNVDFDQEALLSNVGENIILPYYEALSTQTSTLKSRIETLTAEPTIANLGAAQDALFDAWVAWQYASTYEFGPAETAALRSSVNTYPASTQQIENNILTSDYNLETVNNLDAKGFPALDYLLSGDEDANTTVANLEDPARADYMLAVVTDLDNRVAQVLEGWQATGGNYLNTFVTTTGTDAGSSIGLLVNQLNLDYEILKNGQIGIPLGTRSLGDPLPDRVEAYYSGNSSSLAQQHAFAVHQLYQGIGADGTKGVGLEDYLEALNTVFDGEQPLHEAIAEQIENTERSLMALPNPLSQAVTNQPELVQAAYDRITEQVVLFKTDMPSALGVLITYQDNDGD